jgi:hypothetical protein
LLAPKINNPARGPKAGPAGSKYLIRDSALLLERLPGHLSIPVHAAVPESGTVIEFCNNMIEELKPQSDTLLSRLRVENIPQRILTIRGHSVMLDVDLAELYGVTTKRLNEAVRRNTARFPNDFMFQLAPGEVESLRSQFATSNGRGGRRRWIGF